ncbi:hypothetical protein D3C78_494860 [compost metagenome]
MTQTTVLAAGVTSATSSDIVVAAGEQITVGLFSAAAGHLPHGLQIPVMQKTPGADNFISSLTDARRTTVLSGPGIFRVQRPAYTGTAFGAFTEK